MSIFQSLMEDGFIVGNSVIWWTKKAPRLTITKRNGNIQLARSHTGWAYLKAKRCSSCNITVVQEE